MDEDRISLRDLGERLALISLYRKSTSRGRAELLDLLRQGALLARFNFPSNEHPQIPVPARYWLKVKIGEFRKALDSKRKNKGDYLVSPNQFADEYLDWFSRGRCLPDHVEELSAALRAASAEAEVYVLEKDFYQFTTQKDLDTTQHSDVSQKSSRGKTENPNWSAVLVEVAVELLNSSRDHRPATNVITSKALERVTPRGGTQLPKAETVWKKVDDIIRRTWQS